jgi:hypothetical protein
VVSAVNGAAQLCIFEQWVAPAWQGNRIWIFGLYCIVWQDGF